MGVGVGVTRVPLRGLLLALVLVSPAVLSGILPEDRADVLYHSYNGGGVEVTGPSYLVRKGDNKNFSASANYYTDSISGASIDVLTQGSAYSEQRTQLTGGIDYLHADTTMTVGYSNSDESDYKSNTYNFSIGQTLFGGLTTVTLGYAYGDDDVFSNVDPGFKRAAEHRNYHVSLTQVLTKDLLLSLNYDAITDEGYLQNPYRRVRVQNDSLDPSAGWNFNTPEIYPDTRTSNAFSANFMYYLPYRAVIKAGYRYYTDDWDIKSHNAEIGYIHPLWNRWIVEFNYRYYQQTEADFYSDLFQFANQQNFMGRDKELSKFNDNTLGVTLSYDVFEHGWGYVDKATLNFTYSRIWFDYDNYTDARQANPSAYNFNADIFQMFASIWY